MAYLEKARPDGLRALTPRHINAPADYWSQKVLAVSSVNAAMQNYVSIHEHQTRPNPALTAVHGQAALLMRYDVPTYYLSRELLAAALRTELPNDMVFEAIPFPFDGLVFMLPKEKALLRTIWYVLTSAWVPNKDFCSDFFECLGTSIVSVRLTRLVGKPGS